LPRLLARLHAGLVAAEPERRLLRAAGAGPQEPLRMGERGRSSPHGAAAPRGARAAHLRLGARAARQAPPRRAGSLERSARADNGGPRAVAALLAGGIAAAPAPAA